LEDSTNLLLDDVLAEKFCNEQRQNEKGKNKKKRISPSGYMQEENILNESLCLAIHFSITYP